jgi:Nuclease-related domain
VIVRVVALSDHPGTLLREARLRSEAAAERERSRYQGALVQHRARVVQAVQARDQARARHRWWAWLRGTFAVRAERRRAPVPPRACGQPSDQESILLAGIEGEQLVAAGLGHVLDDDWTLIRGYRNRGGEIDHLLLGPGGLIAIEGKHRNATVHCVGDHWWYTRFDNHGNPVERGEMTDRRGRSPSQQVNEPASKLEDFLRSRGHPVAIQRFVLLTHPRSQLGSCLRPTVRIATTTGQVISALDDSGATLSPPERARLERLIIRDHRFRTERRRG